MYIFKNAILNIKRNIGRNTLVAIIVFVILLCGLVAFTINTSADAIIESTTDEYMGEVTISVDMDEAMSDEIRMDDVEEITNEEYEEYGNSDYVQFVAMTYSVPSYSDEITAVSADETTETTDEQTEMMDQMGGGATEEVEESRYEVTPTFSLIGYNDYNAMTDFVDETKAITDGEIFDEENEVIISDSLAEENGLEVGDSFTINSSFDSTEITVTITGIYTDYSTESTDQEMMGFAYNDASNEIMTSTDTAMQLTADTTEGGELTTTYYLTGSEVYEDFVAEVDEKELPDYYSVSYDEQAYEMVIEPLESLKTITSIFMAVVFVFGSAILLLVTSLILRERKYEIGVLRAIGMKKFHLISQFIMENLIIAAIALVIALPIGVTISEPIANAVLESQVTTETEESMPGGFGGSGDQMMGDMMGNSASISSISEIDVSMSTVTFFEIIGVSLVLIVFASGFSLSYIVHFEPIQILSD